MPGFDRSQLKATALANVKQQEQNQAAMRPSGGVDRAGYHGIDDGENTFRILPYHPEGGGSTYAEAKCVSFLSVKTEVRDDKGKGTGTFEIKRRPIFNSKVHGGLPKDLVEVYMEVAKKLAIPNFTQDATEAKRIWEIVASGMIGIKPSDGWMVYAYKLQKDGTWKLGLLELKKTIKNQLTELAASFAGDDVQSPDPFTDADEGIAIKITKSGKGLQTEYKVALDSQIRKDKGRITEEYTSTPLTDEQIEEWIKLDSLHKMYVGVFKRSDFLAQLDGLQRFDEELSIKHRAPIAVLSYDEFLNVVEELDRLIPEESDKDKQEQLPQKAAPQAVATKKPVKVAPVVIEQQEEEQVQEEEEELQQHIQAPVKINRLAKAVKKEPEPTVQEQVAPTQGATTAQARLAALKAKMGPKTS